MAVSKNNVITHGASGMLGGVLVFRSRNGKTFICNRPKKPTKESPVQKENRTKFKRATAFAKQMMLDPAKKAEYWEIAQRLSLPNAYTAAITEYMRKPEIVEVGISKDTENTSGKITIEARKKGFEIELVEVIITDQEGKIIEKGKARKVDDTNWSYTSLISLDNKNRLNIRVNAKDRTGGVREYRMNL
jgi:hypothetical protein